MGWNWRRMGIPFALLMGGVLLITALLFYRRDGELQVGHTKCFWNVMTLQGAWRYVLEKRGVVSPRMLVDSGGYIHWQWDGTTARFTAHPDPLLEIHWRDFPPVQIDNLSDVSIQWHTRAGDWKEQWNLIRHEDELIGLITALLSDFMEVCTDSILLWKAYVNPTPTFYLEMPLLGIRMWAPSHRWITDARRSYRLLADEIIRSGAVVNKSSVLWWMGIPIDSVDVVVAHEVVGPVSDSALFHWASTYHISSGPALRFEYEGPIDQLPQFLRRVWQRRSHFRQSLIDSPWAVILPPMEDSLPFTLVYFPTLEMPLSLLPNRDAEAIDPIP